MRFFLACSVEMYKGMDRRCYKKNLHICVMNHCSDFAISRMAPLRSRHATSIRNSSVILFAISRMAPLRSRHATSIRKSTYSLRSYVFFPHVRTVLKVTFICLRAAINVTFRPYIAHILSGAEKPRRSIPVSNIFSVVAMRAM